MRELHLVGFTADNSGMILAGRRGAKTGGYVIHLAPDVVEQIQRATRGHDVALARRGPQSATSGKAESGLTPREIQSRIRSGRSLVDIAVEAGVGIDWVERFAPPILAERDAVVSRAGTMFVTNSAGEMSGRSLHESVRRNLQNRGVHLTEDELEQCWSAGYLERREWLVSLCVRIKGRDVDAQWTLSNTDSTLAARNPAGEELGFVGPDRPRGRPRRSEADATAKAKPVADEATSETPPRPATKRTEAVQADQPVGPEDPGSGATSGPKTESGLDPVGAALPPGSAEDTAVSKVPEPVGPAPVGPAPGDPPTGAAAPGAGSSQGSGEGSATDRLFDLRTDDPESISLTDLG